MPAIIRETVFAAAGSNPNVNSGSLFELLQRRMVLSMAIVQSVANNFVGINIGPDVVAEEHNPLVLTTVPIIPDHFYYTDVGNVGDRVVMFVRATVAVTFRSVVILADA